MRNSLRINTGHDCGAVAIDTAQNQLEKLKSRQNQRLHQNIPEASKILGYEEVDSDRGVISYYVTDNPESPQPDILVEEVALNG
ncbi:MAG: hypothetical protein IGS39_20655 [Calothrix sp. C42_A2020_038]|nr:hypothetical protein [Calothrix sp. C42_A2020_038]